MLFEPRHHNVFHQSCYRLEYDSALLVEYLNLTLALIEMLAGDCLPMQSVDLFLLAPTGQYLHTQFRTLKFWLLHRFGNP